MERIQNPGFKKDEVIKIFLLSGRGGEGLKDMPFLTKYYKIKFFKYSLRSGCKTVRRYKTATWLK